MATAESLCLRRMLTTIFDSARKSLDVVILSSEVPNRRTDAFARVKHPRVMRDVTRAKAIFCLVLADS